MKKILLIDDDIATRIAIEQSFKDNFQVSTCPNGAGILELIKKDSPDLILLDIHLPHRQGVKILHDLKSNNINVPIFMLTVRADEHTILKCFELGCEDYIVKPFSLAILKARINRIFPQSGDKNAAIGNISFDTKSGVICSGINSIQLTAKEQLVLTYLLKNSNQIISRQQIINFAWGYDYYGTTRTIDNVISSLRKKLNDNAKKPKIITSHRKMGYRLNQ